MIGHYFFEYNREQEQEYGPNVNVRSSEDCVVFRGNVMMCCEAYCPTCRKQVEFNSLHTWELYRGNQRISILIPLKYACRCIRRSWTPFWREIPFSPDTNHCMTQASDDIWYLPRTFSHNTNTTNKEVHLTPDNII